MASTIKGITVKIGGDSTGLAKSFDSLDKKSRNLQSELSQINRLLKFNPDNAALLAQKQEVLAEKVQAVRDKLKLLKDMQADVEREAKSGTLGADQYRAYQREVEHTQGVLQNLERQIEETDSQFAHATQDINGISLGEAERKVAGFGDSVKDMADTSMTKLDNLSDKFNNVGNKLESAGIAINTAVSSKVAQKLSEGVTDAMDFEDAIAKVSTIADENEVTIDKMREQILSLSNDTGIAATDIAENVYNAISAGQKTGDAVNFVAKSLSLSKAGFADTGAALDVLTTIMNAYGMSAEEVGNISDMLIQTQNLGKVTVGELASSMGKVIPTANQYGVSLDQLAAAYSITTAKGIAAAESTTYINSMLNELGKSGTKTSDLLKEKTGKTFTELMKEGYSLSDVLQIVAGSAAEGVNYFNKIDTTIQNATGKSFEELQDEGYSLSQIMELINQRNGDNKRSFNELNQALKDGTGKSFKQLSEEGYDLSEILTLVDEKTGESVKGFSDMWGSAEAAKAASTLLGDSASDFNDRLKEMNGSTGATDKALGKLTTRSTETKKIVNELKNAGIDLGDEVLKQAAPLLKGVMGGVKNLTSWLKKLKPEQKEQLTKALEIIAVIGPGVTILGKLTKGVGSFVGTGAKLVKSLKSATAAQQGLNAAQSANPIGGVITAVVLLTSAIVALDQAHRAYLDTQWEASAEKKFVDEVEAASEKLEKTSDAIVETTKDTFKKLEEQTVNNSLIDTYQEELNKLLGKSELTDQEKSKLNTIVQYLTDNVQGFAEAWDKYTIKDKSGNIRVVGELSEVQDAINKTIDDFQRLAMVEALRSQYSELTEESVSTRMEYGRQSEAQKKLQEQIDKKLDEVGLSSENFKALYNIAKETEGKEWLRSTVYLGEITELNKGASYSEEDWNNLTRMYEGFIEATKKAKEAESNLRSTANLTSQIAELLPVLESANYDDPVATLMAYNAQLLTNQQIEESRWGSLANLQKAAAETGKSTRLGVEQDMTELEQELYSGQKTAEESLNERLAINKKYMGDTAKGATEAVRVERPKIKSEMSEAAREGTQRTVYELGAHKGEVEKAADEGIAKPAKKGIEAESSKDSGKNFVSGFINGMKDGTLLNNLWDAAKNIGSTALNAVKNFLGIHSPSKEAEKLGSFFGEGFSNGIDKQTRNAALSAAEMAQAARNGLTGEIIGNSVSRLSGLKYGEISGTPTVTNTSTTTNNSPIQISVQATINNDADIDRLAQQLGQKIAQQGVRWG